MNNLAGRVAEGINASGATLRVGRVVGLTYTSVTVDMGGGQLIDAPCSSAFRPILGENVQILHQGSLLLAVGSAATMPDRNAVANPSFERDPVGSAVITNWTKYVGSGAAAVAVAAADTWPAVDGNQVLEIANTAATSTTSMLSDPIPVVAGQRWSASCRWQAYADGATLPMVTPTISLWLTWYASAAAAYPTTSAADTLIMQSIGPFGAMPEWSVLRSQTGNGAVVPTGIAAMQVMLRAVHGSTGRARFDRVTTVQLSGGG